MSLALSNSTPNVQIKTWGAIYPDLERSVFLGDYEITLSDFMHAAMYVLTNTDLTGYDDPRLRFLEQVRRLAVTEGYGEGRQRLHIPAA